MLGKVRVPSHVLLSGPCHISRPDVKGAGKGRVSGPQWLEAPRYNIIDMSKVESRQAVKHLNLGLGVECSKSVFPACVVPSIRQMCE